MRSKELNLTKYDTDKMMSNYLGKYDLFFDSLTDQSINLLELGINKGGSLTLWKDYFPNATVSGVDLKLPENFQHDDRIHLFQGSQADKQFLTDVAKRVAPKGFDIIIDDASHIGELSKISFWHLFDNHLKPGGFYVIEDWGTGYWNNWPDGKAFSQNIFSGINLFKKKVKSHNYGMVGFIKQLIDEVGAADIDRKSASGSTQKKSKFENMTIFHGIVFVKKSVSDE